MMETKKIISKQTEDEFAALVVRFASDNGMTASNVKEGMLRVARYFEDNALLGVEDSNK